MDKYDEFLELYKKIFSEYADRSWQIKSDAQNKINSLIDDWGSSNPDEKAYFVFRRSLRCFDRSMDPGWLKRQFDFFRQFDEKEADREFDESVKIV